MSDGKKRETIFGR